MTVLEIFLLSLALAADSFSVATVVGLSCRKGRQVFRLSLHFGVFQSLFSACGALLGKFLYETVRAFDHWVAFGLLLAIGAHMIIEALREKSDSEKNQRQDPTCGMTLIGLSMAVSIDAFGAGVGMAMTLTPINLVFACLMIGLVTSAATVTGMLLGRFIGKKLGSSIEIFGGIVLILLGIRMLLE